MTWPSASFDWNQARAFLATAREGSLSAAARVLGLTQPTLGRQVAALEEQLSVTLFQRDGRGLTLTPSGLELLEHVEAMEAAAGLVALTASGQSQSVEGEVRITASDVMSAYFLPPIVERLRKLAPAIQITIIASNEVRDLTRREADIAIRHVRPAQPDLIARSMGLSIGRLCAATAYLDKAGRPNSLADLAQHQFIGFERLDVMLDVMNAAQMPVTKANFPICSDSGLVVWEMLRQGLGISVMTYDLIRATPGVEVVLPETAPFEFPVWLVTHKELHTNRRIRLVFDLLAEALSHPDGIRLTSPGVTGHPASSDIETGI